MTTLLTTILAIAIFLLLIAVKGWRKEKVDISDLIKCTLAAMALPNLFLCLYYLVMNPTEATKLAEVTQYLITAVLITIYLNFLEIKKIIFGKGPSP